MKKAISTTTFSGSKLEQHHIQTAATLLREGKLVAFPTETVYGLGGNALSDDAVACIYEAKGRPQFNPLIVHVPSITEAERYVVFSETAKKLAAQFWPGPLTLVLPRREDCTLSLLVSAGLDTVAIRVPAHPLAQALLKEAAIPIAAPSANRSGHVSPTEAAHVREDLADRVAMVLDGGACPVGIESTVVDMTEATPVILRPGSITYEDICHASESWHPEKPKNWIPAFAGMTNIKSPGLLEKHYAPSTPLRLNATDVKVEEALLAFGKPLIGAKMVENLSSQANLQEAAANLFRMLRALDKRGVSGIAVMPIPHDGLGVAINDRLARAAKK